MNLWLIAILFPLYGAGRFGTDVVYDPADFFDLIGDQIRYFQKILSRKSKTSAVIPSRLTTARQSEYITVIPIISRNPYALYRQ
jgi:hypothetical protein